VEPADRPADAPVTPDPDDPDGADDRGRPDAPDDPSATGAELHPDSTRAVTVSTGNSAARKRWTIGTAGSFGLARDGPAVAAGGRAPTADRGTPVLLPCTAGPSAGRPDHTGRRPVCRPRVFGLRAPDPGGSVLLAIASRAGRPSAVTSRERGDGCRSRSPLRDSPGFAPGSPWCPTLRAAHRRRRSPYRRRVQPAVADHRP
jgi:hypothetical protein